MIENDLLSEEEQIKLPKSNINNTYKYNYNYYSPNYQRDLNPTSYKLDNNDIRQFNTSPKTYQDNAIYKRINNINHHHHCHLSRDHSHIIHHTPQCRSRSNSPSPIKNISQPLYHTYYNSNTFKELPNKTNFIYNNDKFGNSQNFFSDELSNDISINNNNNNNNISTLRFNENNGIIHNNPIKEINHSKAMDFDDYMTKLVYNKYNKMKQFNESYYLKKQFGDETNYTNINNTFNDDYIKDEFDTMRKNLEKKYQLYNIITKYDNMNLGNNLEENINKNEEDEDINNKKNKEKKNKRKSNKNKKRKGHNNNISSSSSEAEFDSSPEKNNFVKDDNNKRNIIQKTFNENIGLKNSSYYSSTFNRVKDTDKNINNEQNINNSNLLEYLKKENDEIKNLNNNYKQTLDTLFYFLNNVFHKFKRNDDEQNQNNQNIDVFDISKDVNNIENLSKKLINLESLINENSKNDIKNKLKLNSLLMITKENSLQLPEPSKLEKFNDLIEGLNEKCFSFKEDNNNFIERYKNDKTNNNNVQIKQISELNNNENIPENKDIINNNNINNENDKCVACLLGCNVSKRGYSPMRYNPNNNKEERRDDSADLLDKYNEKKEKKEKSANIKNNREKNNLNKRNNKSTKAKSGNSSLINSSNNSRRNSKSINLHKKIWKK